MSGNCYICFEPTHAEVCTCELNHAHPWCVVRTIAASPAGCTRHHTCPACRRGYRSWTVVWFVALRRWWGWLLRLWSGGLYLLEILAQAPPPGANGQHLHVFLSGSDESHDALGLRSDDWDELQRDLWVNDVLQRM